VKQKAKRSSSREKGHQFSDVVDSIQEVISNDGRKTACPFENETTSLRVCFIIFLTVLRII